MSSARPLDAAAKPLGVIAGAGRLPLLLVQEMRDVRPLVVVSVASQPDAALSEAAHAFHRIGLGRIHRILQAFEKSGASEIVLLGSVRKEVVLQPARLDWLALQILARTRTRGDQALLRAIADEFGRRGFAVADQRVYLRPLLAEQGVLTRRSPTRAQLDEAAVALDLARQVAGLDIGQTVVMRGGIPLSVEAMEGTDAAIRRGGALGGPGAIVAKAARVEHDFRFDVPTVGLDTLETLREIRAAVLALEAQRTFLLDRDAFLEGADDAEIAVVAL
jgi:DUF1009 family protein